MRANTHRTDETPIIVSKFLLYLDWAFVGTLGGGALVQAKPISGRYLAFA
jgi:hypothetical protein